RRPVPTGSTGPSGPLRLARGAARGRLLVGHLSMIGERAGSLAGVAQPDLAADLVERRHDVDALLRRQDFAAGATRGDELFELDRLELHAAPLDLRLVALHHPARGVDDPERGRVVPDGVELDAGLG